MDFKDYFILFFFVLAIVLFYWGIIRAIYWTKQEDPNKVVSVLPQLSQTLIGILVGAVAIVIGA